jgi:hypothetical protein
MGRMGGWTRQLEWLQEQIVDCLAASCTVLPNPHIKPCAEEEREKERGVLFCEQHLTPIHTCQPGTRATAGPTSTTTFQTRAAAAAGTHDSTVGRSSSHEASSGGSGGVLGLLQLQVRVLPWPQHTAEAAELGSTTSLCCWCCRRDPQAAVISNALSGNDSLVVMATGGGKSICYQLPPLVSGTNEPGVPSSHQPSAGHAAVNRQRLLNTHCLSACLSALFVHIHCT